MAKFRKRPVVVEAVQWFPPGDPRHDPAMLSHRKGNSVIPPGLPADRRHLPVLGNQGNGV